jgi:hypothetical protein
MLFCAITTAQHKVGLLPSDKNATRETIALYKNLQQLKGKAVLFGHQDDLAYGVGWQYEKGRSDVKEVSGEYPAVFGWELGHLELDSAKSLDQVPFDKIKEFIKFGYEQGAINTISWHFTNPLNGKSAWDITPGSVASILPGGSRHDTYVLYLDRLANFLKDLRGKRGEPIPVLFRPFHELTGNWFWWCQNVCSPEEFISIWRFTADYLRNKKGINQLLYVYNTAEFNSREQFLERYPGDDYVDMISFDSYQHLNAITEKGNDFIQQITSRLKILEEIALEKGKLTAFAETGFEAIPQSDWWTKVLLPALKTYKPGYVLVWRNAGLMKDSGKMHYYAPYKGQVSEDDFRKFFNDPDIWFLRKTQTANLYKLKNP